MVQLVGPLAERMAVIQWLADQDADDRATGRLPFMNGPGWRTTREIADHFGVPLNNMRKRMETMWQRDYVVRQDGITSTGNNTFWRTNDSDVKDYVLQLVQHCVRHSSLEDLHTGTFPRSETGDYSDVKVVSPYGEIPWDRFSRLSDVEMKSLMMEIVDRVYTFITATPKMMPIDRRWPEPKISKP